jgi:hypothetical protein
MIVKMIDGERSCMQGSESKLLLAACARVHGTIRSLETLAAHGLEELFSSCAVVSIFVLAGNRFWFYILLMYSLEYNAVVVLCSFFDSGGK